MGAAGFSTHDRALATERMGEGPYDVAMIRHSAAHLGAEERLFGEAQRRNVGVLTFSATSYGRLLRKLPDSRSSIEPPTAAECYRYDLSTSSRPPRGAESVDVTPGWANLEVLDAPPLDPARMRELRAHGRVVREASLDFAAYIRRFPALPDPVALDELDEAAPGAPP